MTADSTSAKQQIIERMQVPGRTHQYVLGCFESRITLYTQQVRALNLIYALSDEFKKGGTTVAVIGAGAGGLMAAAAAAACGGQVSVFDSNPNPLDLIGPSHQRWLHPHIYEWPKAGSENARAELPFLDWEEGPAIDVVSGLRLKWSELAQAYNIEVHGRVKNLGIDPVAGGKYLLRWNGAGPSPPRTESTGRPEQALWGSRSGDRMRIQRFDVVILAVGFGVESPDNSRFPEVKSYWLEDNIDRDSLYTSSLTSRVLVSGTGDGGLIDLLRYSFKGFRHEYVLSEFQSRWLERPGIDEIKERIIKIEETAWDLLKSGEDYRPYLNLSYRDLADTLVLKGVSLRENIQPVLTGRNALPLDLSSAPINRFFFSLTNAQYIPGPVVSANRTERGKNWVVTFENGPEEYFDEVVIRHGPVPAVEKHFPDIWELCASLREQARRLPDPTREPLDFRRFYEERLRPIAALLKPESSEEAAEEIERAIPSEPPPAEDRSPAVERYLETYTEDPF